MTNEVEANKLKVVANSRDIKAGQITDNIIDCSALKISSGVSDAGQIVEIAIRNGYIVKVIPVPEPYWKTKIDHFEISFEKHMSII